MSEHLSLVHPDNYDVPRVRRQHAIWKDWDRTLGRVDPALNRLWTVAGHYGVDVERIQHEYATLRQRQKVSNDGGSYEPVSAIEAQILNIAARQRAQGIKNSVRITDIATRYAAYVPRSNDEKLIYDDTPGLIQRINASGAPNYVKTYGKPVWQKDFKIAGGGYNGYVETTDYPHKATEQHLYLSPGGTYDCYKVTNGRVTAVIEANEAIGIDDKPMSLTGGPDNFTGYLLRRPEEEILEVQQGDWPEELTIRSLGQLVMDGDRLIRLEEPIASSPTEMPTSNTIYVPIRYGSIT